MILNRSLRLKKVQVLINLYLLLNLSHSILFCSASLPYINSDLLYNTSLAINTSKKFIIPPMVIDDHICTREENYTEIIQVPVKQPVRVRTLNWCLEVPPRCSSYRTEIRELIKTENITKTRQIRFCCEGYTGILSGNETICRAICRGGCGRGFCQSPDKCRCDAGYIGKHCTQRCPPDRWGDGCMKLCMCRNGAVCDNKNGSCKCSNGWIGELCHVGCPSGFYGAMCKTPCECSSNRCNPQTGECILEESIFFKKESVPTFDQKTSNISNSMTGTEANDSINLNLTEMIFQQEMEISTNGFIPDTLVIKTESPFINIENKAGVHDKNTEILSNPEVIHVIDWQQFLENYNNNSTQTNQVSSNDFNVMITSLIILVLGLLTATISITIFYRKHCKKREEKPVEPNSNNDSNQKLKMFPKPLPDLPAFTQNIKIKDINVVPEFYDCPSNNATVMSNQYSYAAQYSTVAKPKTNLECHLYDEIRYPGVRSCRV